MAKKNPNMQAWILQIIYQDFLAYLGKNLYCVPFIFIANNIQICVIFYCCWQNKCQISQELWLHR